MKKGAAHGRKEQVLQTAEKSRSCARQKQTAFATTSALRRSLPSAGEKIVVAVTGASGAIYLQRLLPRLVGHEVSIVFSANARVVIETELGEWQLPDWVTEYDNADMSASFASGSALWDAMVVVPCSMGTIARIAAGTSDTLLLRAADVFLKERRKLILVPREMPWSLIHARNAVSVIEAGAVLLPAMPSFYSRPTSIEQVADTVVFRILDALGIPSPDSPRWGAATQA